MAHNSHKHTNVGITLNKKSKDNQLVMQREKKCHECSVFKPHHLVFQTSAILMQHKIETCWNLTKCAVKFCLWNLKFDKVKNHIDFLGNWTQKFWQNSDVLKFDKGRLLNCLLIFFCVEMYTTVHSGNEENIVDQSCMLRHLEQPYDERARTVNRCF